MARYIVGDLQGCLEPLNNLLDQVDFDPKFDQLWCVGDLIARGPDSLACIRRMQELGNAAKVVLGNHDINLLAVLTGVREANPEDKLDAILALPEAEQNELMNWLVKQPLLRVCDDMVMTHAGIYPWWSLADAQNYAHELSQSMQRAWRCKMLGPWLDLMYGNEPNVWHEHMTRPDHLRFVMNALTRMRYVYHDGRLEFDCKEPPSEQTRSKDLVPWFELWEPDHKTVFFGHWAALHGRTHRDDVIGLDTGCVWGEHMTMLRWPTGQRYTSS